MNPEFKARFVALVVAGLVAAVQLAVEHAVPWHKLVKRRIGPPWSYAAGVASLGLPFSVLTAMWGDWWGLAAFWTVAVCGGFSVFFGYDIRMRLENQSLRADLNRAFGLASDLIKSLRGGEPDGQARD